MAAAVPKHVVDRAQRARALVLGLPYLFRVVDGRLGFLGLRLRIAGIRFARGGFPLVALPKQEVLRLRLCFF